MARKRTRKRDSGSSGGEAKIINALATQGPTIPTWSTILAGFPINSPLIGSFLCVVFGSAINCANVKLQQMWHATAVMIE